MKKSDKLLVEQAWSLRTTLNRSIDTERIKRTASYSPSVKIERLNTLQSRAYSRYLRRLKQYWA